MSLFQFNESVSILLYVQMTARAVKCTSVERLTVKDAIKILAVTGVVVSSLIAPNLVIGYAYLAKQWKKYKRGDVGRIIKRLHKQELVRIAEKDGQTLIELSDKGKNRLLQYNFDDLSLKRKRDGKLRMVIFDIPRSKNLVRDMLRSKLTELGFIKVQESVFVTPYICQEELEFIVHYLEIADYVMLFQINKTEIGPSFEFNSMYK